MYLTIYADLRRSVLRRRYRTGHEKYGLSHYLSGQAELEDTICETNVPDFHIIFAGPVPPNPSELLGNQRFHTLLQTLRAEYDYVIVDTPPLGSVIDGAIVARESDGTVLIIESNSISYKAAQNIVSQLEKAGCRLLGCVLNKVDFKRAGRYGKYYEKYYYSYYASTEEEGEPLPEPGTAEETKA